MVNETLYDAAFLATHEQYRPAIEAIADTILSMEGPGSIVDVGCGTGFLVEALRRRGFDARGIDGTREAERVWPAEHRDAYAIADLTDAEVDLPRTDLVCSFEVGEHLPEEASERFVGHLVRHRPRRVFFSAATPGQEGVGHVNGQPPRYWIERFARRGYALDVSTTVVVRKRWREMICFQWAEWFPKNFLTFVPAAATSRKIRPAWDALRLALRAR